eukprot:TRINITY_DN61633_c0_g1_i1.p1 TRINITY_DN61633_c0_g1~~TRINITY_DN61633_c0_g1_i1.p1  ORF type:complete len:100 (-),score=17.42 TRINITY_DN61633_c0_g1_i1:47-346(-)
MPTCHESAELLEQYGLAYIRTSQHEQLHRPISRAGPIPSRKMKRLWEQHWSCLLYTSDAADEEDSVDIGGHRVIKKKKKRQDKQRQERKDKKGQRHKRE